MSGDPENIHRKEAEFHDRWAQDTALEKIDVRAVFESPVAMENRFILGEMGPLAGKRVLDVGCGLGESSAYFAMRGAKVTAADVSPEMVRAAQKLAEMHGEQIGAVVGPAEALEVSEGQFDFVYIANTLHHATDKRAVFGQIHRALRSGGKFFSIDPLAYNPVINVYRRMASEVRTVDERPLTFGDLQTAGEFFRDVGHQEFWIASLALFLKYYLLDRVHPNQTRYWKRIFEERRLGWWKPLAMADSVLTRLPVVRRMAWNMVMWGTKE